MKYILHFILFYFILNTIYSQNSFVFMPVIKEGFLFPHKNSLSYFNNKHINEFTFEISKQLNDTSKWHKYYQYPSMGGGIYYTNLPSDYYTGNSLATFAFIDIPIKWYKICSFNYFVAFGLAILTKHFDKNENYYNIGIGSTLNAYVNLGLHYSFYLNKFQINTGFSFTHYSNGAWKKPNAGFNIPALKLGIGLLSSPKKHFEGKLPNKKNKQTEWSIILTGGTRQNYPSDINRYYVGTFAVMYEKQFSTKHKWGIGLDIFYDPSIPNRSVEIPIYSKYKPYFRSGIRLSHDLIFGKTSFTFQTGSYVYDKYLLDRFIYTRLGLRYKINNWLAANVFLKTHFFRADVIEFGISIYKKKEAKITSS